ncbi:hypothetical protein BLSTO_04278 [Blastocystis sp. subtype 1]
MFIVVARFAFCLQEVCCGGGNECTYQAPVFSASGTNAGTTDYKEELNKIREQMETLLSIEGMAETAMLPSYMNEDGFLPVSLLLNLISTSLPSLSVDTVIEAVQGSDKVVVDGETKMIRPAIPVERKTIILRDVADDVTEDDIRQLFEGVGSVESIKPPVGNNWFIVMTSEAEALSALKTLRSKTLKDMAVHARIKNESRIMTINRMINALRESMPESSNPYFSSMQFSMFSSANMTDAPASDFSQANRKGVNNRGNKTRGKRSRRHAANVKPIVLPQLSNVSSFPPLVFTGGEASGYGAGFVHYSKEELLDIVKGVKDLSLPATPEGDFSLVLSATPNSELVSKQRTMSIDQSIEAGKPRTFSVDSVDYTTMLVGDEEEAVKEEVRRRRKNRKPKKLDYAKAIGKGKKEEK